MKTKIFISLFASVLLLSGCTITIGNGGSNANSQQSSSSSSSEMSSSSSSSAQQSSASSQQASQNAATTTAADGDFGTRDIDVPLNSQLTESMILEYAITHVTDTPDGSYKKSMKVSGLNMVNTGRLGEYQVTITASSGMDRDDEEV